MTDVAQIIADIEAWLDKATPGEWTIEPHGDGQVLYSGRGPTRHGLNLVYLREGDWNWHTNANYIVSVGPDRIRALLDEVKEKTRALEFTKASNDILRKALDAAEDELARLRSPAGEVGEVVTELNRYEWAHPILKTAAELLTRQAAEIERTHGEYLAERTARMEANSREADASEVIKRQKASLREAVEVIRQLRLHVPHNSVTAERARAFLSTLEPTNDQ